MNRDGETLEDRLHDEFGLQWDGDPKMGGGFYVCSIGTTWRTEKEARNAIKVIRPKPGLRIVHRWVSDWESP